MIARDQTRTRTLSRFAEVVLVFVLLLGGFAVRLYDLTDPPLDFHASRQLRSAIITRSFYWQDLASSDPTDLEISQKAAQLAELETYEPPIMEWLVSRIDLLQNEETFWNGRIFSAFFWSLGGLFVYLICRRRSNLFAAVICLLYYLFLPFSIIAGRSFQPDPWMCAWCAFSAWLMLRWSDNLHWRYVLWMGLAGGMALLTKLFAIFFIGGMLAGTFLSTIDRNKWRKALLQTIIAGIIMLLPSMVYYFGIHSGASGNFFSFWIASLTPLILTGKFYAGWIAMIRSLTGFFLPLVALISVLIADRRLRGLLIGGWIGYFLYGLIVPYQIITHEYYSLILVPLIAVSLSTIATEIGTQLWKKGLLTTVCASALAVVAAGYGAYAACGTLRAADFRLEPPSWRNVGAALPDGVPFIALTADYGMRLNYYGWKSPVRTWPDANDRQLAEMRNAPQEEFASFFAAQTEGIDLFLVTALGELENQPDLKAKITEYPIFNEGNGYLIFDLRREND